MLRTSLPAGPLWAVSNAANRRYEGLAREIDKAMRFMAACGVDFDAMKTTEFWSAHEALLLDYERPMTRVDSRTGDLLAEEAEWMDLASCRGCEDGAADPE